MLRAPRRGSRCAVLRPPSARRCRWCRAVDFRFEFVPLQREIRLPRRDALHDEREFLSRGVCQQEAVPVSLDAQRCVMRAIANPECGQLCNRRCSRIWREHIVQRECVLDSRRCTRIEALVDADGLVLALCEQCILKRTSPLHPTSNVTQLSSVGQQRKLRVVEPRFLRTLFDHRRRIGACANDQLALGMQALREESEQRLGIGQGYSVANDGWLGPWPRVLLRRWQQQRRCSAARPCANGSQVRNEVHV